MKNQPIKNNKSALTHLVLRSALKGLENMTRFSALAALTWFAMCFFFLDASAYAVAMDVLPVTPNATDDMDAARISFLLYTSVPMLLWLFEALRKEAAALPAGHN
jgi:hypothetical protein